MADEGSTTKIFGNSKITFVKRSIQKNLNLLLKRFKTHFFLIQYQYIVNIFLQIPTFGCGRGVSIQPFATIYYCVRSTQVSTANKDCYTRAKLQYQNSSPLVKKSFNLGTVFKLT